jgi:hypothetical protein
MVERAGTGMDKNGGCSNMAWPYNQRQWWRTGVCCCAVVCPVVMLTVSPGSRVRSIHVTWPCGHLTDAGCLFAGCCRYATRARSITVTPTVNCDAASAQIGALRKERDTLAAQLVTLQHQVGDVRVTHWCHFIWERWPWVTRRRMTILQDMLVIDILTVLLPIPPLW